MTDDQAGPAGDTHDPATQSLQGRAAQERAALHEELRTLVTGYGDDELGAADRGRVEAHLVSCEPCRRDLITQQALRRQAAGLAESSTMQQELRLTAMLRANAEPAAAWRGETMTAVKHAINPYRAAGARRSIAWGGWLLAAGLAGLLMRQPTAWRGEGSALASASLGASAINLDAEPVPMVEAALEDYARHSRAELPASSARTDSMLSALPLPVALLRGADVHPLTSWHTEIRGEPASAVAYRWGDQIIVQYTVSEKLFFRQARVRHAVGRGSVYAVRRGPVSAVAWPNVGSGSIVIGVGDPAQLAALRS